MMASTKKRMVACPNCKKTSEFTPSNAFRPFCSERCKMIDLGLWASEQYAIPENSKTEDISNEHTDEFIN